MYVVKSGDDILYSDNLVQTDYVIYSTSIDMELNRAATFRFVIPPSNPNYDKVEKLKKIITVWKNGERVFRGRVVQTEVDFYNQMTVECESEMAFLNDVVLRPYEKNNVTVSDYFTWLITQYNAKAPIERQMVIGSCTVTPTTNIQRANENYPTVLEEIQAKLIDLLGGYITIFYDPYIGKTMISYNASSGAIGNQRIQFGQNLLDLNTVVDTDEFYTVIIPLGATVNDERVTIKSVTTGGVDYIASANAAVYGVIERVVEWDDVTLPSNLKTKAETELAKVSTISNIEVSAVDLSVVDGNVDSLKLGYSYRVVSVPHGYITDGWNNNFTLVKVKLDLQKIDNCTYTFSNSYSADSLLTASRAIAKK